MALSISFSSPLGIFLADGDRSTSFPTFAPDSVRGSGVGCGAETATNELWTPAWRTQRFGADPAGRRSEDESLRRVWNFTMDKCQAAAGFWKGAGRGIVVIGPGFLRHRPAGSSSESHQPRVMLTRQCRMARTWTSRNGATKGYCFSPSRMCC
ncbi:hypothetical protein VTK26DRAFT_464 [Humicola hyalothermophila]